MDEPENTTRGQHPVTYDQPLPGFYPCLTLQLNVTRYAATGLVRMVLVVREPSEHVECFRMHFDQKPWASAQTDVADDVIEALRRVAWLQDGVNT